MTKKLNIEQKIKTSIKILQKAQADLKAVNSKIQNYRTPTHHQGLLTASYTYNALIKELNDMRYRSVKVAHDSAMLTYGLEAEGKKNNLMVEWDRKSNFALSIERIIGDLYDKSLSIAKNIASQNPGRFPTLSKLQKVNIELNRIRENVAKEYKVVSQIDKELENSSIHMRRVEKLIDHLSRPSTTWDEWIKSTEVV